MTRRLLAALVLAAAPVLGATPALAQDARLVLREAVLPEPGDAPGAVAGMERVELPAVTPGPTESPHAALGARSVFLGDTLLGPGSVLTVAADRDAYTMAPRLLLTLAPPVARAFERLTRARIGDTIALVLDGRVLTAPRINGVIDGGQFQIEGVGPDEADPLVAAIRDATRATTRAAAREAAFDLSTPEAAALSFARANGQRAGSAQRARSTRTRSPTSARRPSRRSSSWTETCGRRPAAPSRPA